MRWRCDEALKRTSRAVGDGGFTLLELLVALAIVGLVYVAVPQVAAGLAAVRLRGAAAQFADQLREAREAARRTGRTAEFSFKLHDRTYTTSATARPNPLPDIVENVTVLYDSPLPTERDAVFRFFPDGSATGGSIVLSHDTRHMTIVIDWLTGRVRNDD